MVTDIINNLSNNIEGINQSLKTLAEPSDAFMPIATITTLITTLIGTAIGTGFTMWLFKKQEKMRIREELRLDFYKNYKKIYKKLTTEIGEINYLMITFDERYSTLFEDKFDELLEKIVDYTSELSQHYQSNKIILNKEYDYFEKGGKMKEIYECYEEYQGAGDAWYRLKFKNEIPEIIDDLTSVHSQIENDFISKYFR